MQHIGEGRLDIPASWHNQSVNIFSVQPPGQPGLNLTINRDRLPLGVALKDYAQEQMDRLAQHLDGMDLLGQDSLELDGRPAVEFEFVWRSEAAGPVHQLLLSVAEGASVLNIAATSQGRMEKGQLAEVRRIVRSFEFNRPDAGATEAEATL